MIEGSKGVNVGRRHTRCAVPSFALCLLQSVARSSFRDWLHLHLPELA